MILLPYVEINGTRTLSDNHLADAYERTKSDGSVEIVFSNGSIQSAEDFVGYFRSPDNLPVFAFSDDKRMVGYAWLNCLQENRGFAHFNFFKESWGGLALEAGKEIVNYWFSLKPIELIMGLTPVSNERAIAFIKKLGFVSVGEIPFIINNFYSGKKEPGLISYKAR